MGIRAYCQLFWVTKPHGCVLPGTMPGVGVREGQCGGAPETEGQGGLQPSSPASGEGRESRPPPGGHLLLTVGVQECEHLGLRHAGPQQPGRNESFPLLLPYHPHDLQLLDVLLQPLLQVFWKGQGHRHQLLC